MFGMKLLVKTPKATLPQVFSILKKNAQSSQNPWSHPPPLLYLSKSKESSLTHSLPLQVPEAPQSAPWAFSPSLLPVFRPSSLSSPGFPSNHQGPCVPVLPLHFPFVYQHRCSSALATGGFCQFHHQIFLTPGLSHLPPLACKPHLLPPFLLVFTLGWCLHTFLSQLNCTQPQIFVNQDPKCLPAPFYIARS